MAYRIGAKITGKEWNDGHSGSIVNPAACYDGWHGMFEQKPGTTGVEVHHDLGVDGNYSAYMLGNPISTMGPGSASVSGGPYRPEGFSDAQPGCGKDGPLQEGRVKMMAAPADLPQEEMKMEVLQECQDPLQAEHLQECLSINRRV